MIKITTKMRFFLNSFIISNKFIAKIAKKQQTIRFERLFLKTDFAIFFNFKTVQFFSSRFVKKTISKNIQKFIVVFDVLNN